MWFLRILLMREFKQKLCNYKRCKKNICNFDCLSGKTTVKLSHSVFIIKISSVNLPIILLKEYLLTSRWWQQVHLMQQTVKLAPFCVLCFVCLPCTLVKSFPEPFFPPLSSPPIPQDTAAVNRFTFPHSKVRSAYVFPPRSSLSSLIIWLFLLNLSLSWGDRLIQHVTLITVPL